MTSRQEALWGRAGQELIYNSKILITGLTNAGVEAIKTAAMLGVGKIYLIDESKNKGFFLDNQLNENENTAVQLENIVNGLKFESGDTLETVKVEAFAEEFFNNEKLIENLKPDAIFDFTGDLSSQTQAIEYGISLAQEQAVDVFLGDCDGFAFTLNHYSANSEDVAEDIAIEKEIEDFEDEEQGVIMSHMLGSIAIEHFRKNLFIRNNDLLANAQEAKEQEDERNSYQEAGEFKDSISYSTLKHPSAYAAKKKFKNSPQAKTELSEFDLNLSGKKFLVCGCGAIGNPVADMLVRSGASRIDLIDYDHIESHNIERQPFYCGRIDELKAEVLCEKIKKIAEQQGTPIECNALVGKVCDEIKEEKEKQSFDKEWFKSQDYDIVFGCFDGPIARETLNEYAAEIGFKYIDGGSQIRMAKVTAFIPGKTSCLDCTMRVKFEADAARLNEEHRRIHSCTGNAEIVPSVNTSNRIAAALMVAEASKILNSNDYEFFSGFIEYNATSRSTDTICTKRPERTCDLCKNDNTDGP